MHARHLFATLIALSAMSVVLLVTRSRAEERAAPNSESASLEALAEGFQTLFNEGKAAELAASFAPDGELVDDQGNLYRGREELQGLFKKFFATFPGAKLNLKVDSLRMIGTRLAIEEGARVITVNDHPVQAGGAVSGGATTASATEKITAGADKQGAASATTAGYTKPVEAHLRYLCVWTKTDDKWQVASVREFADDPAPTPHERLEPLAWLVGEWVHEGDDSNVYISYHWSDDGNFLVGDYKVTAHGKKKMDSVQRVGWDPLRQEVRSWLFDSDGGYGEGEWTTLDDGYLVRSSAVTPDGSVGSANLEAKKLSDSQFVLKGTNRIVAGEPVEDFQITISKKPPQPSVAR
jgi:uncharacterized protein (TIGR02246 family)